MDITRFYRAELADKDRSLSISLVKGRFCDRTNLSRGEKTSIWKYYHEIVCCQLLA